MASLGMSSLVFRVLAEDLSIRLRDPPFDGAAWQFDYDPLMDNNI